MTKQTQATCPSNDQLRALLTGRLESQLADTVATHLDHCGICLDTISECEESQPTIPAGVGRDDIDFQFRQEPSYRQIQERIREIVREHSDIDPSGTDTSASGTNETISVDSSAQDGALSYRVGGSPSARSSSAAQPGASVDPAADPMTEALAVLQPSEAPDEIGRIGAYRVKRILGAGGMGVVFAAEDPYLHREIAIKVLKRGIATPIAKERFLREARAAASIDHENIVPVYEVSKDPESPFLVMPLLKGESLRSRMKRDAKFEVAEVLRIGQEVARGLSAAHDAGLIHRDIKPDNLWIDSIGDRVKILDFGLARSMDDDSGLTHAGAVVGTPKYMSPEQTLNHQLDHRTDLFSLGSVLYHLATGAEPFAGDGLTSILMAVSNANPTPIEQIAPELPQHFIDLVSELLQRNPDDRPATASAVASRLQSIASQESLAGLQPQNSRAKDPPANKRTRWLAGAVGASLLALLAAVAIFIQLPSGATLRVDINDPQIEVAVKGTEILLRRDGQTETTVKPGNQTLIVRHGEEFQFEVTKLILKSGETTDLQVAFVDKAVEVKRGDQVLQRMPIPSVDPAEPQDTALGELNASQETTLERMTEEEVARKVFANGGQVIVRRRYYQDVDSLPKPPFTIEGVTLDSGEATISDLLYLTPLANLQTLQCRGADLSESALQSIAEISSLHSIAIRCDQFQGKGLRYLKPLKKLTNLDLAHSAIDDDGAREIATITSLETINLGATQITDPSVAKLCGLPKLKSLFLNQTRVTDQVVAELKRLNYLKFVDLSNTQVTDEAIGQLNEWFPSCEFVHGCDAARRFADWPDAPGILLTIQQGERTLIKKIHESMPVDDFRIVGVSFHAHQGRLATDDDISRLLDADLPHLTTIDVQYQTMKLGWLRSILERKPMIENMNFGMGDEYLDLISRFKNLHKLQVSGTTDRWTQLLSTQPTIESLYIQNLVSVEGFARLASLPNLKELRVTGMTDETMRALTQMEHLEKLAFDSPGHVWKVTPVGIGELANLKSLKELEFQRPGMLDLGVLKGKLPGCVIRYRDDKNQPQRFQ